MRVGIRNTSLDASWLDSFSLAGEKGYDGVELVVRTDEQVDELGTARGRAAVIEAAHAAGCGVSSLCIANFRAVNFALADGEARDRGVMLVQRMLKACRDLGGEALLLPHFIRDGGDLREDEERRYIDELRRCKRMAEDTGVGIGLESSFSVEQCVRVCQAVNSPQVGVYNDTANAVQFGHDLAQMLRCTAPWMQMLHIKDTERQMLGEGAVDWPSVAATLHEIDYGGWLVLETPSGEDPLASAERNREFVRSLLGV